VNQFYITDAADGAKQFRVTAELSYDNDRVSGSVERVTSWGQNMLPLGFDLVFEFEIRRDSRCMINMDLSGGDMTSGELMWKERSRMLNDLWDWAQTQFKEVAK